MRRVTGTRVITGTKFREHGLRVLLLLRDVLSGRGEGLGGRRTRRFRSDCTLPKVRHR